MGSKPTHIYNLLFSVEQIVEYLESFYYLLVLAHIYNSLSSAYISIYIYIYQEIWTNSCSHLVLTLTFLFPFLLRVIPTALVPLEV
jgi:hypothetical protein